MRRNAIFALALVGALFSAEAEKKDWANFARYEKSNAELLQAAPAKGRVVFLGNSITDFWPANHLDFFTQNGYIGRGISGQTSYQFLARFREDVVNLHPDIVVINAATNDIAENTHPYDAERTFGNIKSMVEIAEANGIQVVLSTTLPAGKFGWNPAITDGPEKIAALNARLRAYAAEKGLPFADYFSELVAADGRSLDNRYSGDGVHPNGEGYEVMEKVITKVLQPLVDAEKGKQSKFDACFSANETPYNVGKIVAQRFVNVPHPNFDGNPAPTREITYPETCAWIGAIKFASLTGDTAMTRKLEERFLPLLGEELPLRPKPDHVDHTVFGAVPLGLYLDTNNKTHLHLGKWYADRQWMMPQCSAADSARYKKLLDSGKSWQTRYWIDDMYMISAVQGAAYRATGDRKYLDRAAHQMTEYLDSIQCDNGLFYHAPDAPYHWCRGNGWMAAGMTELLSMMPDNHPDRERIMASYKKMMEKLLKLQRKDGLWGQLLDDKKAWSETSGSGMFLYAMITGVNRGWLDEKAYLPAIVKGWKALVSHINEDGDIDGVCEGTNRSTDRDFYLKRRTLTGNMHGQAPLLWCVSAFLEN